VKKIAIFDIDGTIFRSSLVIELTEALIQVGIFPRRVEKFYEKAYRNWLDRKDGYEKYIKAVVRAFGKYIQGKSVKRVDEIAKRVVEFHKNRVYRYTRDLVRELRKKNYYVIAISHSPEKAVRGFSKNFGFSEVFGTVYTSEGGKFDGGQTRVSKNKDGILKFVLKNKKLSLRGSVGVGDTEGDTPFLKMVENPICFNPNAKLYKAAKRNRWKVVVERKDVIYFLN
jgi:HAD superfamily hydrolase (TIGR01490 family)